MSPRLSRLFPLVAIAVAVFAARAIADHRPSATTHPHAVGLRVMRFLDHTRTIRLPNGRREWRPLTTYVRYPAASTATVGDLLNAPVDRRGAPYPLIVFGHGFALTPAPYARLLQAWTGAGYVVAAPVFPLENAHAPGGPQETDLINQPADVSFVISQLIAASTHPGDPLAGLIDGRRIAVAGHSDGGDTALTVTYDQHFRDPRIRAAVIMSGAEINGLGGYEFRPHGPALLATQGTRDTINPSQLTQFFYAAALRPKFLLTLTDASHLAPYTWQQPQLGIVEQTTTAFLNHYLKHQPLEPILAAGNQPPNARLTTDS